MYISGFASDNLIDTGVLEKIDEQIEIYDSLTIEEQVYMLEQTLYDVTHYIKSGYSVDNTIYELYMTGNETLIEYYLLHYFDTVSTEEEKELSNKINDIMIHKRNDKMSERIIERIKDNNKTYFFTMGVGHLVGNTSILETLKENDFTITRVTE
jgi:uncharacterized protein YbaP (TraB family)